MTNVVWVLMGHYKRKQSDLLGVYMHYGAGKLGLEAAALVGDYHEVELKRTDISQRRGPRSSAAAKVANAPRGQRRDGGARHRRTNAPDAHLARRYGVSRQTIQKARTGQSWQNHPTPPDRSERIGGGRKASAKAEYA